MPKLDQIDRTLLRALQENSQLTLKELAAHAQLSVTPTHERIKRLEKLGVITQYVALINPEKVGKELTALISLTLSNHSRTELSQLEKAIHDMPQVTNCFHLSGEYDYMLQVVVNDMKAYRQFIMEDLSRLGNVFQVKSHMVMNHVKSSTAIPIDDE